MPSSVRQPVALNLPLVAKGRAQDESHLRGKSLPCTVAKVLGSGIVQVNLEVDADPFTLPRLTVPVAYPEYIRYPIQVGDKGYLVPADARLGGLTGLGSGVANLTRPGNLSALAFLWLGSTAWSPPEDPNSVEIYGVHQGGVIIRSAAGTNKITVNEAGITINMGAPMTINTNGNRLTIDGNLYVSGEIQGA